MPIFEQGYRAYHGELSRGSRALAIAWENVRPRLDWRVWVLLLLLLLWPYFFYGILVFAVTVGPQLFGGAAPTLGTAPQVAFESVGRNFGGSITAMVSGANSSLYWEVLHHGSLIATLIIPAIACAGILASDRRTGALQIYFARPVTRWEYLLGKVLATSFFVALTTAIPALLLWLESMLFNPAGAASVSTWMAPLAILGASAVYAYWTSAVVLAFSASLRRPVVAGLLVIFGQYVAEILGTVIAESFRDPSDPVAGKAWQVLRPSYALGGLTAPLFGLQIPEWMNLGVMFGIALGIPTLLFVYVTWRVRAVEVVT